MRVAAAIVIMTGVAVLAGWIFDLPLLKSLAPGWATMKVNTAIGFISSGGVLVLLESSKPGLTLFRLGRALAVLPLLIAC